MLNSSSTFPESIIEVRGLTRQFGNKVALNDVSLSVPRGGVFGLIGGNGAGKTTLIRHILGLLKPQQGTVQVFSLDPIRNCEQVLARIGYLSEERDLPNWMRIHDLLGYTRAFYPRWDDRYAEELRDAFELSLTTRVHQLSRGQRARAGLLLALAHRPDLLVLDEPSSGLDPVVRRDILSAIIRTIADEGRTVLFSSHLLDEVERVADHIAILHQGRILLSNELAFIKESHRKLTVRLATPSSNPPPLVGAFAWDGEGLEWTYVCEGDIPHWKRSAESIGASIVDESTMSLEEIFVSHIEAVA